MRSRRIGLRVAALAMVLGGLAARGAPAQEAYPEKFSQRSGQELFQTICQACHMPDAKGAVGAGAYPALAANKRLAAAVYPITVVVHGQRGMPRFGEMLDDEQIANVLNYIRTHFGNHYKDTITPAEVKARR